MNTTILSSKDTEFEAPLLGRIKQLEIDNALYASDISRVREIIGIPGGNNELFEDVSDRIKELEAQIVSGFYEEQRPVYRQGVPQYELESAVTAKECNGLVARIAELETQLAEARKPALCSSLQE